MDSKVSLALRQQLAKATERLNASKATYDANPTEKNGKDLDLARQAYEVSRRNYEESKLHGDETVNVKRLQEAVKRCREMVDPCYNEEEKGSSPTTKEDIFLKVPMHLAREIHATLNLMRDAVDKHSSQAEVLRQKVVKLRGRLGEDGDFEPMEYDVKLFTSSTKHTRKMQGDELRWTTLLAAKRLRYETVYLDVYPKRWSEVLEVTEGEETPVLPLLYVRGHIFHYDEAQEMEDAGVQGGRWQSALRLLQLNSQMSQADNTVASSLPQSQGGKGVTSNHKSSSSSSTDANANANANANATEPVDTVQTKMQQDQKKMLSIIDGEEEESSSAAAALDSSLLSSDSKQQASTTTTLGQHTDTQRTDSAPPPLTSSSTATPSKTSQGFTPAIKIQAPSQSSIQEKPSEDGSIGTPATPGANGVTLDMIENALGMLDDNDDDEDDASFHTPPKVATPTLDKPPKLARPKSDSLEAPNDDGRRRGSGGRRGRDRSRSPSAQRVRSKSPRPPKRNDEGAEAKTSAAAASIGAGLRAPETIRRGRSRSSSRSRSKSPAPPKQGAGGNKRGGGEEQPHRRQRHVPLSVEEQEGVVALFTALDVNKTGSVQQQGAIELLEEDFALQLFKDADSDKDGTLTLTELTSCFEIYKATMILANDYAPNALVTILAHANENMKRRTQRGETPVREVKADDGDYKVYQDAPVSGKGVWGRWTQPDAKKFKVRDSGYLSRKQKRPSDPFLFPIQHVEFRKIEGGKPLNHICAHEDSWWRTNKPGPSAFALIFNIQVTSIGVSVIMYHILPNGMDQVKKACPRVHDMLHALVENVRANRDKAKVDARFKFIPRVVTGPFIVRCAVKETPVIMGQKVSQSYYSGNNYLEVDVHVDSSYAANAIIKLAHAYSVNIECDMVWLLEAKEEKELPERLLAGVRVSNVDFSKSEGKPLQAS